MDKRLLMIALTAGGIAFSGYLSFAGLILGICPLIEGCPSILGIPSCIYGLALFTTLLILSILEKNDYIFYISIAGVTLSIYSTIIDFTASNVFSLGLPSCVYGGIMYMGILILSKIK